MISLTEWATKNDISARRARVLAAAGRIKGAQLIGKNWIVPQGAKYPKAMKPGRKAA